MNARDGRIDVLLLVTVAAAALLGGLLAVLLLYLTGPLQPRIMMFVVVVVTLLAVFAVGTLQTSPRRGSTSSPQSPRPPQQRPPSGFRGSTALPNPTHMYSAQRIPPRQTQTARSPTFSPPPAPPQPPPDVRPPDYETWQLAGASPVGPRRVVQCPECGDFEIDLRPAQDELTFTCRTRGHRWTWSPGRPWPATVIRPAAAPVQDADRV